MALERVCRSCRLLASVQGQHGRFHRRGVHLRLARLSALRVRRIVGFVALTVVLPFFSFAATSAAVQARSGTAKIDYTISGLVKAKLVQSGYPSTWKTSVQCRPPGTVKSGTTFRCMVYELPPRHLRPLNEGTLRATASILNGSQTTFVIQFQAVPTGLDVGPGPLATYTVEPQPAAGSCHYAYIGVDPLPDPRCTPGAINPLVTQANINSTICRSGYTSKIRPPEGVTEAEKAASARAYGYTGSLRTAEYDHLISLALGGDPNDSSNLWVEPNDRPGATSTSNTKDILENRLRSLICSGQVPLAETQQAIASNWVAAYAKYLGAQSPSSTQPVTATTAAPAPITAPAPTPTAAPPRTTVPPVPPVPTPAPAPPPPPASTCTASMSNPTPGDGGSETLNVSSNVPNTAGAVNVHYKTTTHPFALQTDPSGNAAITFDIGHPTVGYQVQVDVAIGAASCSTSFTPQ
jgi:hypothetical protein